MGIRTLNPLSPGYNSAATCCQEPCRRVTSTCKAQTPVCSSVYIARFAQLRNLSRRSFGQFVWNTMLVSGWQRESRLKVASAFNYTLLTVLVVKICCIPPIFVSPRRSSTLVPIGRIIAHRDPATGLSIHQQRSGIHSLGSVPAIMELTRPNGVLMN